MRLNSSPKLTLKNHCCLRKSKYTAVLMAEWRNEKQKDINLFLTLTIMP
jgi:hypothetical protein